jgi:hydrogenase-4 component B
MTGNLIYAALALFALAVLTDYSYGGLRRALPHLMCAAAAIMLVVAGMRAALDGGDVLDISSWLAFGTAHLRVDPLAGFFLAVVGAVEFPIALGFAGWRRIARRGLGALHALTAAAVVFVVLSDNVFYFFFAWEGLTVCFYLLAVFDREKPDRVHGGLLTVGIGKIGGACLLLGFLLLAGRSGSFLIPAWQAVPGGALKGAAYALLLVGFFAKVGVAPVQIWMPSGYPAAPGPARALMAGVGALAGFYGLWRTLDELGRPPTWLAVLVLLVAAFTALLGIAHATVQQDLRRVIAYSSVENGGLIVTGYGVALTGAATGDRRLVAAGLLAATLQLVAHAVAKSALFLATANIDAATGTTALDDLAGLGRDLPWSGTAFGIGALTLAGLPPTAGFVSEWFILESLMQQFRLSDLTFQLTLAVAGALVALTAGFAAVAFVRILGLTILGSYSRRGERNPELVDAGVLGRAALGILAVGCVALAALTPLEIRLIADGLGPVVGAGTTRGALATPWVLGPVYPEFSVLSPSWLAIELPIMVGLVVAAAFLVSRGRLVNVRRVPAWRSATGGVIGEDRYTEFGYANPTRRVLANLLRTRSQLTERDDASAVTGSGTDQPVGQLDYKTDVVEVVEQYLYNPIRRPLAAVVRAAKSLQSGRLEHYLAYMLVTLIALLIVVIALR